MSWNNSDYAQNFEKLKGIMKNLSSNYSFNYFIPDTINSYDLDKCYSYSSDSSNNKIDMNDISNFQKNGQKVYHTNYTCKLNATLLNSKNKMEEYENINNITKNGGVKQGLLFKIVNGYYKSNAKFFLNYKDNYNSTLVTKFENIQSATNNSGINYTSYSIEWYGYIKPDKTGNWKFTLNSDNTSLLWLGDIAINDYENINAFINTKGSNSGTIKLNQNKYYPIRIQYGNEVLSEQNKFSLSIEGPNGQDGIPLLCCLYNSDGTLFEKTLMYYSLNEITPDLTSKGLFECSVNDPKNKNNSLQLKQTPNNKEICDAITQGTNPVHYNKNTNKNQYLYIVDGDSRMNQLFMKNSAYNENKLLPVSYDDTVLTNSYNKYEKTYPLESDKSLAKPMSYEECQKTCNDDPNCRYYYTYESDEKKYCIKKNDEFPSQFIPSQPDSNMNDSKLFIRSRKPKSINQNDIRNSIETINTNDYKSFSNYEIISDKKFILNDKYNIGYNGLCETDKEIIKKNYDYVNGNGRQVDGFENYGYMNNKNISTIAANPGINQNIPTFITDNQINPLTKMYQDYSKLQQNINDNYYDISSSVDKIKNNSKTGVRDILSDDPDNIYDFSGNVLNYTSKKPKKRDALKEDNQVMILEQNNLLMLGTITIATLLIGAIYFGG